MASVRVIWTGPGSVAVNITLNGSAATTFSIGGTPVSFPYTISSPTSFDTSTLRTYSVSVQFQGTEIASSQGAPITFECGGDPGANLIFAPAAPTAATNSAAIAAETTRAQGAEAANATAISNETTRATTAEGVDLATANAAIGLAIVLGA